MSQRKSVGFGFLQLTPSSSGRPRPPVPAAMPPVPASTTGASEEAARSAATEVTEELELLGKLSALVIGHLVAVAADTAAATPSQIALSSAGS